MVPHIDGDRIEGCWAKRPGFRDIERLENITKMGVPVDVDPGGDLEKEIAYGNHVERRGVGRGRAEGGDRGSSTGYGAGISLGNKRRTSEG